MVQWFCPTFKSLFDIWKSYLQTMKCYATVFNLNMNTGHYDLYFMVQWFCFISRRSFDICTSYFQIMKWYDTTFDLNMIVSHCDLHFMVQWFCSISESPFDIWTSYFQIIKWCSWHNYSPQYECKSLWPIFHGPVILLYISKIIWHMHIIFSDYEMYDTTFDLTMIVSHCDQYFMVRWVCLYLKAHWHMNIILPDYEMVWRSV